MKKGAPSSKQVIPNKRSNIEKQAADRESMLYMIQKYLEETQFHPMLTLEEMKKMSSSEFKAIFKHLINTICPGYQISDMSIAVFNNILKGFLSKSTLTNTHLSSPSLISSGIFSATALDYLRRISCAVQNTIPEMMFPVIESIGITTEVIFLSLIEEKKRIAIENFIDPQFFQQLRITVQKKKGILTDEDKSIMKEELKDLKLDSDFHFNLLVKINGVEKNISNLEISVANGVKWITQKKELSMEIKSKLEEYKLSKASKVLEKNQLAEKIERFAEQGFDNLLAQLNDEEKMLTINDMGFKSIKVIYENSRSEIANMDQDLQKLRIKVQEELVELNYSKVAEFREVTANLSPEHLLDWELHLEKPFFNMMDSINELLNAESHLLIEKIEQRDHEDEEYAAMRREGQQVTNETAEVNLMVNEVTRDVALLEELLVALKEDSVDEAHKQVEEALLAVKEEEHASLLREIDETRRIIAEAKAFFEADMEVRTAVSELELKGMTSRLSMRSMVIDLKRKRADEDHEWAEEIRRRASLPLGDHGSKTC